jgi:hypothetical protein
VLGTAGVPFSGDMSGLAGSGGGGGAPGPGDASGHIFIGPGGYDAASGTRDDPFGTLERAAAVAKPGDTIVFLAGNYTLPELDAPIVIPDGVDIAADQPRLVALTGTGGTLLELAGDTTIDGIRFSGFSTVVGASSDHGSVTVTNTTFGTCPSDAGTSVIEVGGGASVTLTADSTHDWGDCPAFAHVVANGSFTLDGGLVHTTGAAEPAVFAANGSGKLAISNLLATDGNRPLFVLADESQTTLATSTLATLATNAIVLGDQASLDMSNTDVSLSGSAADSCIQSNVDGTSSLTIANSLLHGCRAGVGGTAPATFTLSGSELYAMGESGLDFATANPSTVKLESVSFHDGGERAARFGGGSPSVFHLAVRDTSVSNIPTGFELAADASSTWDFGTLADPGGNTLTAATSALVLSNANATFVAAVGNTWTPDVQDADGAGRYTATGAGAVLEVTSGSGQNYTDDYGGTIRLSENP